VPALRLDLGCGPNPKEGFRGVDSLKFDRVDVVTDLRKEWPWPDNSVTEVHCSHTLEHFERRERVHFMNELYRVLKPGKNGPDGKVIEGFATIVVPHWSSNRAYGDMTHCWPPVSEMFFYYLSREWRQVNCPHDDIAHNPEGYSCHFGAIWGYSMHPHLVTRNAEYQQHALQFWKEAAMDISAVLTAIK
jgi:SAM-dependent methyltransferase